MGKAVERDQLAAVDSLLDVSTDLTRRQSIVCALNHQRGNRYSGKVTAIVGQESGAGEYPGACRVGATEAISELVGKFRLIRRSHNHGRHRSRPPKVVA